MEMARFVIAFLFMFNLTILPSWASLFPLPNLFESHKIHRHYGYYGGHEQPFEQVEPEQIEPEQVQPEQPAKQEVDQHKLQKNFYEGSCPEAEKIVAAMVAKIFKQNPGALAALLRLHFHDCFVGGCDASILLDSTPGQENVEKKSAANVESLKGADIIDDIKAQLEQKCPETVSCADTLAFAAREALVLAGLQRHAQLGGRRDSLESFATNADILPNPNWTVDQMLEFFKKKGFNEEDMVVLLGAHSIGSAHCAFFSDRLYNYKQSGKPDPNLNLKFLGELKGICLPPAPNQIPPNTPVDFDETPTKLDNLYFKNLVQNKALLGTDQGMASDPRTAPFVKKFAEDARDFTKKFTKAIISMGSLDVLTGNKGEVRKICRSTN